MSFLLLPHGFQNESPGMTPQSYCHEDLDFTLSLDFFSYIYLHGNNSLDLTSVVSSKKFGVKLQEPGYDKCQPIPIK